MVNKEKELRAYFYMPGRQKKNLFIKETQVVSEKEIMKLDDHYSEGLNELMDLGSEYQWLPTPQKKKDNQAVCLLMKEYNITYSLTELIEHNADLTANLEKRQVSQEYAELQHECAVDKTWAMGNSSSPGSSGDKL